LPAHLQLKPLTIFHDREVKTLIISNRRFSAVNDKETRTFQMLTRFDGFCDTLTNDFAANSVGKQLFANLKTKIAEAESLGAAETSGRTSVRHGTGMRNQAREALRDDLEAISRTARMMADDIPALLNKFPMPSRSTDQALINAARAFLTDAQPYKAQFIAHELPADFLEDLADDIEALETAIADQGSGIGDQVAAGAGLGDALDEGVDIVRKIGVIIRNKYANRSDVLAALTSASHIERAPRRSKAESTPPPAPPQ
jgi:hypothetical protein